MIDLKQFTQEIGIEGCLDFDPAVLIPQEWVRAFCAENKCGYYGKNYMCPPHVGMLDEIQEKINGFSKAVLLQYSEPQQMDLDNLTEIMRTKNDFHKLILQTEEYLKANGVKETWGLIGGNCGLCERCAVRDGEPCRHPEEARPSLESIGIDVLGLLKSLVLDDEFHPDKITWTGAILYND